MIRILLGFLDNRNRWRLKNNLPRVYKELELNLAYISVVRYSELAILIFLFDPDS
jgi:hypothetical protein